MKREPTNYTVTDGCGGGGTMFQFATRKDAQRFFDAQKDQPGRTVSMMAHWDGELVAVNDEHRRVMPWYVPAVERKNGGDAP